MVRSLLQLSNHSKTRVCRPRKRASELLVLGCLVAATGCMVGDSANAEGDPLGDDPEGVDLGDAGPSPDAPLTEEPIDGEELRCLVSELSADYDGDGTLDLLQRTTFDEQGRPLHAESGDGSVVRYLTQYYYFEDSVLAERDDGVDGSIDKRTTQTYDARGNRLSFQSIDSEGDGFKLHWTFDARDNVLTETLDSDDNGTIDRRTSNSYTAEDQIERTEIYSPGDSLVSIYDHLYNTLGLHIEARIDQDADGVIDSRTRYDYDANGNEILVEFDQGDDSSIDERRTRVFDLATNLELSGAIEQDGALAFSYSKEYEQGRLRQYSYDFDGDGAIDIVITYGYDLAGNETSRSTDKNNDGLVDEVSRTTYDQYGNILTMTRDVGDDGNVESSSAMVYQCF